MRLPSFVHRYFWDIDPKKQVKKYNFKFVISRLLDFGDKNTINWMFENFDRKSIKNTIESSKISTKSKNFWQHVY